MNLTKDRFQKAKEKFVNDKFMDDGTKEAQTSKLVGLSIVETFIENWFLNYGQNADVDEEEFLDFARTQIVVLMTSGVAQKQNLGNIKAGNAILLAFICVVHEMYFEPKEVAGTC